MLNKMNPTRTQSWKNLAKHFEKLKDIHMRTLFAEDLERFKKFSIRFNDTLVDYSKNIITEETVRLLIELADEVGLIDAIEKMFAGDRINETEDRAVLHIALRNRENTPIYVDGKDVMPGINAVLGKMEEFSDKVSSGEWRGFTGKKLTDIVHIGIGGSDLGPFMATECLRPYGKEGLSVHFVSNVDGTHIVETLKRLNPETTLFLIASKTFTTQETMTNAFSARYWFLNYAKDQVHVSRHFVAISTNAKGVEAFGIDKENMFILVPVAPGLEDNDEIRERYYNKTLEHLEGLVGENIRDSVVVKRSFAHRDFTERYNAYKGTALGFAHTLRQTAIFRPRHRSKKVKNLYYTGHYTHPGIGVPMVIISSQILHKDIGREYDK